MKEVEEKKKEQMEWGFFLCNSDHWCPTFLEQGGAEVAKVKVKLDNLAVLLGVQTDRSSWSSWRSAFPSAFSAFHVLECDQSEQHLLTCQQTNTS